MKTSIRRRLWLQAQGIVAALLIGALTIGLMWVFGLTPWQVLWGR